MTKTDSRPAWRIALLPAALLLALAAVFALAASASAQTPDDGDTGTSNGGTSSASGDADDGDDDPVPPPPANPDDDRPDCSGVPSLDILQDRYYARLRGTTVDDSDKLVARIPPRDRLTDLQLQCALIMQDDKHPMLRWHYQTRCPVNDIHSIRLTGLTQTVDDVLFEQIERVEDYRCTSTWLPIMTDGSDAPAGLIPPAPPISIITVRYRVTLWRVSIVPGLTPDAFQVTPPQGESHLAD